jgi:short-subunit dehydrogenase
VWGIAREREKLQILEKELASSRFFWTQADVTDHTSLQRWREEMRRRSFEPDCLLLNASVQHDDLARAYDHSAGIRTLRTNLEGALGCVSLFLPDFLRRHRGRVIAIGSTASLRPSTRSAAYAASKAGLAAALRSLRLRYAREGLQCAQVVLGPIATDMWEGKRHWLIPPPADAAKAIARFVTSRKKTLYYPFISTTLLRASLCLPDSLFAFVSTRLLK